jgi:hypothetical protein
MSQDTQLFVVERHAAVMTRHDLDAAHHALVQATRRLTAAGDQVRYLRSTYLPTRQRWMGLFAATARETVHRVVEMAQLPWVEVLDTVEPSSPDARRSEE